ncbi:hypothetical protein [Iodidimonas nitroreducens]|nr:hypothetical protein [Iodidimonas nitroreducens]
MTDQTEGEKKIMKDLDLSALIERGTAKNRKPSRPCGPMSIS